MENKLYVEFRVYLNPQANQEMVKELAEQMQERLYDDWNCENEIQTHDITYEIVMKAS